MGPAGLEVARQYLQFTNWEIQQANAAAMTSSKASLNEWLETNKRKLAEQKKFVENLNSLAAIGLSSAAYNAFMEAGLEGAGDIVSSLIIDPNRIFDINDYYKELETLPDELANQALTGAAAAAAETGNEFRSNFIKAFGGGVLSDAEREDIKKHFEGFVETVAVIANGVSNSEETADAVSNAAKAIGDEYINGLESALGDNTYKVTNSAKDVGKNANDGITQYLSKANGETISGNLNQGLINGLNNGSGEVAKAATAVASAAYTAILNELQIHSPSRKFVKIGMYADMGFANGLKDYSRLVEDASSGVADSSMSAMSEAISKINEIINPSDEGLVIKPILDLSNVTAGAIQMKRMFDDAHVDGNVTVDGATDGTDASSTGNSYNFVQNNYSPKALSRIDIYRQTKNQFAMARSVMG
jgi:hypothetical protein